MLMMLAEQAADVAAAAPDNSRLEMLIMVMLAIQVLTVVFLGLKLRAIALNEVELGDLIRKAVAQIESDLPKK